MVYNIKYYFTLFFANLYAFFRKAHASASPRHTSASDPPRCGLPYSVGTVLTYVSEFGYSSSPTGSSHSAVPAVITRWENHESAVAPCQCFTPSLATATSPARSLTGGLPSSWYQPSPAVARMIWNPPLCLCQLLRTPGSKLTFATVTGTSGSFPSVFM